MCRVGVEEAAAVGPEHLYHFLRSDRTLGDELLAAFQGGDIGVGGKILRDALPDHDQTDNDTDGQQHVQRAAGHIDPEIANAFRRPSAEAADQGKRQRDPGGGAEKVVHREAGHLDEVAERGFRHVGLPVRVCNEADRGIEREVGRHCIEVLRVQRQERLQSLQRIQDQETGEAERQHGDGVGYPVLLLGFTDTGEPVKAAFQRPQHKGQGGSLAGEDARHVAPQRLGEEQEQNAIDCDLQPAVQCH